MRSVGLRSLRLVFLLRRLRFSVVFRSVAFAVRFASAAFFVGRVVRLFCVPLRLACLRRRVRFSSVAFFVGFVFRCIWRVCCIGFYLWWKEVSYSLCYDDIRFHKSTKQGWIKKFIFPGAA